MASEGSIEVNNSGEVWLEDAQEMTSAGSRWRKLPAKATPVVATPIVTVNAVDLDDEDDEDVGEEVTAAAAPADGVNNRKKKKTILLSTIAVIALLAVVASIAGDFATNNGLGSGGGGAGSQVSQTESVHASLDLEDCLEEMGKEAVSTANPTKAPTKEPIPPTTMSPTSQKVVDVHDGNGLVRRDLRRRSVVKKVESMQGESRRQRKLQCEELLASKSSKVSKGSKSKSGKSTESTRGEESDNSEKHHGKYSPDAAPKLTKESDNSSESRGASSTEKTLSMTEFEREHRPPTESPTILWK